MQPSLRFWEFEPSSGRTLHVRLVSVTDNTSAADHAGTGKRKRVRL
jgi:hypothetical protein